MAKDTTPLQQNGLSGRSDSHWPLWLQMIREEVLVQGWRVDRWELRNVASGRSSDTGPSESAICWLSGPDLVLFDDERAAYRFNLSSDNPRLFVVCNESPDQEQPPEPVLVTLSQDEAASYLDGEDQLVYSLPLPEAIQCWAEAFIGRHGEPDLGLSRGKRRRYRAKSEVAHG